MPEWNDAVLSRRFTPKEVAAATGVPEDRQRLLASRHFDFRESIKPDGGHRRWTWAGVQTFTAFADALADLGNADRALTLVKGDSQTMAYEYDSRESDEEILLLYHFDQPALTGAQLGTPKGLFSLYGFGNTDVRPGRVYSYNLSAMQRRLCEKLRVV